MPKPSPRCKQLPRTLQQEEAAPKHHAVPNLLQLGSQAGQREVGLGQLLQCVGGGRWRSLDCAALEQAGQLLNRLVGSGVLDRRRFRRRCPCYDA